MRRIVATALMLVALMIPALANDFSLIKTKPKPIFSLLQFTGVALIKTDIVVTYNSIWNSKGKITEANPFWRSIHDRPPLVFVACSLINIGVVVGSSWLYKKNKFLAYLFIVAVNVVEVYCIYAHLRLQSKLM